MATAQETFELSLDRLLRFNTELVELLDVLATEHPDHAFGQALIGYTTLMSTAVSDVAAAASVSATLSQQPALSPHEQAHAAALAQWVAGDWAGASATLDDLLGEWPGDLLALAVGHQLDFYLGDARNLRDRAGRSLVSMSNDDPHIGFVRGMHAFGLEEAGHYDLAEAVGQAAVAANPDDVWAIHAVTHTYEMQGRVDTGIGFLDDTAAGWRSGNLFTVHLWWHQTLFDLEVGRYDEALATYDREIHHAGSDGVPLEMVDASALLWRCLLDGHDVGDRWHALADAWAAQTDGAPWYAFDDVHAVMAYVGADRLDQARAVVDRLERYVAANRSASSGANAAVGTNVAMTAEVGLPLAQGLLAFGEQRYGAVVDALAPIRHHLQQFGGSHAQRDAFQRTLVDAALASGQTSLARGLLAERLSVRDTSVYGWTRWAQMHRAQGATDEAARADVNASLNRARFRAA
jgi:tetratricopeptide (TPR) repeat protein